MQFLPALLFLSAYTLPLIGAAPVDGRCTDFRAFAPSLSDLSYMSRHAIPRKITTATSSTIKHLEPGFHEFVYQSAKAIDSGESYSRIAARHAGVCAVGSAVGLVLLWILARCLAAKWRKHRSQKEWGRKSRGSFIQRSRPLSIGSRGEIVFNTDNEKEWDVRWARETGVADKAGDAAQGVRLY
ncbi:uncharacterized protein PG998_013408 [Apiospora kogelbergensis]|uniref:uncharacterized protein n=1 Tax=Apiospora kogelbergensis TaxID=1337665 RepID=UPI0031324166